MDERQIVRLCLNGHMDCCEALIVKYEKSLYRYCFYLTGTTQEAKDLFQETWLKAIGKLKTYNVDYSFKTWLWSIASNEFKDRHRRKTRWSGKIKSHRDAASMDLEFKNIPSQETSADKVLIDIETKNRLKTEVNQLKIHYKTVVILYYYEEQSLKEISSILKIPEGTVKSRLNQARKILKTRMEEME